jgi:starch synthase
MRSASTRSARPMPVRSVRRSSAGVSTVCCATVAADLSGILNGVDYSVWDPGSDRALAVQLYGRQSARQEGLQAQAAGGTGFLRSAPSTAVRRGQPPDLAEGYGSGSRALAGAARGGRQLVVIGSGEADIEAAFRAAAAAHPRGSYRCIWATTMRCRTASSPAADILLVPVAFRALWSDATLCLRYGTLPLVRRVGGLADTVIDATPEHLKAGTANGFRF